MRRLLDLWTLLLWRKLHTDFRELLACGRVGRVSFQTKQQIPLGILQHATFCIRERPLPKGRGHARVGLQGS